MKIESVEIYSDASNAAILRHPGRRFPGVLVQGDTLHSIVGSLQIVMRNAAGLEEEPAAELAGALEQLRDFSRTIDPYLPPIVSSYHFAMVSRWFEPHLSVMHKAAARRRRCEIGRWLISIVGQ
jgi:hypothetical protein